MSKLQPAVEYSWEVLEQYQGMLSTEFSSVMNDPYSDECKLLLLFSSHA